MQGFKQLPAFSAAEGTGQRAMDTNRNAWEKETEKEGNMNAGIRDNGSIRLPPLPSSPPPDSASEKKKRASPTSMGPLLHPLPTIETIMTYPYLSRPTYDSIVRGEPPAQTYNTVIHTPKPPHLSAAPVPQGNRLASIRALDLILKRADDLQDGRRSKRSRSSTGSSTASSATAYSAGSSSTSSVDKLDHGAMYLEPPSPSLSIPSTTKTAVRSSPPTSAPASPFPALGAPEPVAELDGSTVVPSSRASSPASFRTSLSTLSSIYDSYSEHNSAASTTASSSGSANSTRSSAPSPASSAYPSPPRSPLDEASRRSSSSEEWMYPSPPVSPPPAGASTQRARQGLLTREHRAFTFPPPPSSNTQPGQQESQQQDSTLPIPTPRPSRLRARADTLPALTIVNPPPPASSTSFVQHRSVELISPIDLGGEMPFTFSADDPNDDGASMEWSMNGGQVVFGAAGLALSPRLLGGFGKRGGGEREKKRERDGGDRCCCECKGLGLYVIEEERDADVDCDGEEGSGLDGEVD